MVNNRIMRALYQYRVLLEEFLQHLWLNYRTWRLTFFTVPHLKPFGVPFFA